MRLSWRRRFFLGLIGSSLSLGCPPRQASGPQVPGSPNDGLVPGLAAAVPGAAAPLAAGQTAAGRGFVSLTTSLRRLPTEAREVDAAPEAAAGSKKKRQPNLLTAVFRGEPVKICQTKNAWVQVELSDGMVGWLRSPGVLSGIDGAPVQVGTTFVAAKTFFRPDLLALNASRSIEPGSLLFILRTVDQFSEVNVEGNQVLWLLAAMVCSDANEVQAAKLIGKARALQGRQDPNAQIPLDLAKTYFPTTRLVQELLFLQPSKSLGAPAEPNALPLQGNVLQPPAVRLDSHRGPIGPLDANRPPPPPVTVAVPIAPAGEPHGEPNDDELLAPQE
jgi:SH3-like domain-containing protein